MEDIKLPRARCKMTIFLEYPEQEEGRLLAKIVVAQFRLLDSHYFGYYLNKIQGNRSCVFMFIYVFMDKSLTCRKIT